MLAVLFLACGYLYESLVLGLSNLDKLVVLVGAPDWTGSFWGSEKLQSDQTVGTPTRNVTNVLSRYSLRRGGASPGPNPGN